MKISLITVCFNSDKTIKDTLDSVLSQDYEDYEYIIVDGLSKDKTLDIVKKYEKKFKGKLKYISEKDKGLYDAMNKGIKMASGDVIGILNSDDILANNHVFSDVANNIGKNDGVYSNLLMLDEKLEKPYRLLKYGNVKKRGGWHPPHPTLYLKKSVYKKVGYFDLNFRIAADLDLMLRIIYSDCKLKYVDSFFVYMRGGGTSTAGLKGYYKNFKDSYNVLKKNKIKFPLITNCFRTLSMFSEISKAKKINLSKEG